MDLAERFRALQEYELALLPPISSTDLDALEKSLPCPLPADIRAVLQVTRGVENGPLEFDMGGAQDGGFGLEEVFPCAWPIAHDGCGNYWVVDLLPLSTIWGPIYLASHDPPVIVYQCADLGQFLDAFIEFSQPPHKGPLDFVHADASNTIWANDPNAIARATALVGSDSELRTFAETLTDDWRLFDLRNANTGQGFAWGRAGSPDDIKRWKHLPIFAYRPKKSLFQRLFGKK